jgi:pSer/pThr/pTyr-binding forkhead associated (FHA) protein
MAKLILTFNGKVFGEYPIVKERMTVGRKPGNDIQIDNLAVSSQHAAIITILDDSFLEDLESTNGTFVNGKRIKKHALQNGDIIGIGKHELKYISEHAGSRDSYDKTMVMRPPPMAAERPVEEPVGSSTQEIPDTGRPERGEEAQPQAATLQVLNGPNAGKTMQISKALTKLGKPGKQVAVIARRPHGYFLTHVEGEVHTSVNGESIGVRAHSLNDHDVIELGGVKIEFFYT